MRGANKLRTGRARRLRLNSTNAELRLWNGLRARAPGDNDVMTNMSGVLEVIASSLNAAAPPHPVHASGVNRPLPASGER
jgi:hypothetical protein